MSIGIIVRYVDRLIKPKMENIQISILLVSVGIESEQECKKMRGDWIILILPCMLFGAGVLCLFLKAIISSAIYFIGAGITFYAWLDWW